MSFNRNYFANYFEDVLIEMTQTLQAVDRAQHIHNNGPGHFSTGGKQENLARINKVISDTYQGMLSIVKPFNEPPTEQVSMAA